MIYREMPATWDSQFRPRFYAHWGRENAIISAATRSIAYPDYTQLLSLKAASGGEEEYFVDGRRIAVDENTYLILNAGRTYGSRVRSTWPVHSFTVFFRPGLVEDVRHAITASAPRLLEERSTDGGPPIEFAERLHPHDRSISPVLRHIFQHVSAGHSDELWVEEQLHFLLQRMLKLHSRDLASEVSIRSARPATRKELFRRLGLGVSFMHSRYREPIGLEAIAAAAHVSRFHFLRTFKAVYGVTPSVYLNRQRTRVAARLLASTTMSTTRIADDVGFGARTTLFRHLRAAGIARPAGRRSTRATAERVDSPGSARDPSAPRCAASTEARIPELVPAGWYE